MWVHPTVTASTMIARFNFGRKVRCHKGAVEIFPIVLLRVDSPTLCKERERMGHPVGG
jgi:hypothetical protein